MVEEMFNSIKNGLTDVSKRVDKVDAIIQKIAQIIADSMTQIAGRIGDLSTTLEDLMKISEFKKVKDSLSEIVGSFRSQLDPKKFQKLITEVSEQVKKMKEKTKGAEVW